MKRKKKIIQIQISQIPHQLTQGVLKDQYMLFDNLDPSLPHFLAGLITGISNRLFNFQSGLLSDWGLSTESSGHRGRGDLAGLGNLSNIYLLFLHSRSNSSMLALEVRQPIPVVAFPPA